MISITKTIVLSIVLCMSTYSCGSKNKQIQKKAIVLGTDTIYLDEKFQVINN